MFRKNSLMANEPNPQELLQEVCRKDPRYPPEAYEFLFAALGLAQHQLKSQEAEKPTGPCHVTGQELCLACRDLAISAKWFIT
jgi:uncharacterized repeat protein (TIGR04138 family)